jgi:signal transduction histidine kinase
LSEERNNLIHVMAHDLRTPLAQVSGLNELLKDSGNVTTEQLEYIQLIDSASKNGLSLIAQMMESVNREQLERPSRIHEDVDLHGVIDGSLSLYEAQARNKNIRLIFDNETDDPVVKSDAQAIRRVIDNLVSNAIKYTFPDTEVRVTLTSTDHNATICVKDSGPGFSEDDKALLFRKFTTLSARPTGNESSTGLGLAIVNDLLAEIGGTVALVDDGKPGAYFCVTIPRDEKRDTRHETRDARHETRDTRHKI